jgi:hypothetical protein
MSLSELVALATDLWAREVVGEMPAPQLGFESPLESLEGGLADVKNQRIRCPMFWTMILSLILDCFSSSLWKPSVAGDLLKCTLRFWPKNCLDLSKSFLFLSLKLLPLI